VNDKKDKGEEGQSARALGISRGLADDQIMMTLRVMKKSKLRPAHPELGGLRKVYQPIHSCWRMRS
jgi:hypothetical protein